MYCYAILSDGPHAGTKVLTPNDPEITHNGLTYYRYDMTGDGLFGIYRLIPVQETNGMQFNEPEESK